jgi:hypothetical protein
LRGIKVSRRIYKNNAGLNQAKRDFGKKNPEISSLPVQRMRPQKNFSGRRLAAVNLKVFGFLFDKHQRHYVRDAA